MLHRKEARTLGLAALGAMLEYYDFVIFLFVAAAISEAFFPPGVSPWVSQMQTLGIFAIGYLVRPIAGIVLAHFADLLGRKKMFIFLLILMAVPTFLVGVLPTYEQVGVLAPIALLVLRALQGCAVGGEFPGAAVFVSEHASPSRLGTASGTMHGIVLAGLLLGTGAAALSAYIASHTGMPSLAWRLPFLVGGAFGLTAAWLRRQLEESPLYAGIQQSRQLAKTTPVRIVLTQHADACLFGLGLGFTMAIGTTVFFQYMPTLLATQYGVPRQEALQANMWGSFALCVSMPFWGRASDALGWSRSLGIGAVAKLVASIGFFQWLPAVLEGKGSLPLLFALPGVALGSVVALVPGLLSALFPTHVRQSGYAVPYNVGAALFAGFTPLLLAWMVRTYGGAAAMYLVAATAFVTAVLAFKVRQMRMYLGVAEPQPEAMPAPRKAG